MPRIRKPARNLDSTAVVSALYETLLARTPVQGEEQTKVEYLDQGGSVSQVIEWIMTSPEFRLWSHRNPILSDVLAPDPLPMDTPRLYLRHLPKTGGTSLREMLSPHFTEQEFCGAVTMGELYSMSLYRLRGFRVICGHFGPTLLDILADLPIVTVTIIREPVAMIGSHYIHWRDKGIAGDPLTDLARNLSFDDWCRHDATAGLWSNPQATSLCLPRIPPDRTQTVFSPEGTTVDTLVPGTLPEVALATLDATDLVATTGDLLLLYRACLERLGVQPTASDALRSNVGAGLPAEVNPDTRDWLLQHNQVDTALYARADLRAQELAVQRGEAR